MKWPKFVFPRGPVIQITIFLVFVIILTHLVIFLIFTRQNSSAFFNVNRGLMNRQIITLIEAVAINAPEHRREVIALADIPNVQAFASDRPAYKTRFDQIDFLELSEALPKMKLVDNTIQISVNFGDNAWLNISAKIVNSHWTFQLMLFLFELLLAISVIFSAWTFDRFNRPLRGFIHSVEQLGKSLDGDFIDEHQGPQIVREAVKAVNHMQHRIQSLIENRTQVLAAISHDLRTPITRLKLRAQFLEEEEIKEKIIHDLEEMEGLINQSLTYFKQQYQKSEKSKVDLNSLLESICTDYQEVGKPVVFQHSGERQITLGNAVDLRRAFSNLIDNGLKYGQQVKVVLRASEGFLEVLVEDRGSGISEAELSKVFEPFYRTEQSRNRATGGSGLGLSVVRDIIQSHEGEIQLTNRQSGGLRVIVRLPIFLA